MTSPFGTRHSYEHNPGGYAVDAYGGGENDAVDQTTEARWRGNMAAGNWRRTGTTAAMRSGDVSGYVPGYGTPARANRGSGLTPEESWRGMFGPKNTNTEANATPQQRLAAKQATLAQTHAAGLPSPFRGTGTVIPDHSMDLPPSGRTWTRSHINPGGVEGMIQHTSAVANPWSDDNYFQMAGGTTNRVPTPGQPTIIDETGVRATAPVPAPQHPQQAPLAAAPVTTRPSPLRPPNYGAGIAGDMSNPASRFLATEHNWMTDPYEQPAQQYPQAGDVQEYDENAPEEQRPQQPTPSQAPPISAPTLFPPTVESREFPLVTVPNGNTTITAPNTHVAPLTRITLPNGTTITDPNSGQFPPDSINPLTTEPHLRTIHRPGKIGPYGEHIPDDTIEPVKPFYMPHGFRPITFGENDIFGNTTTISPYTLR